MRLGKVVFGLDFLRNIFAMDAHILIDMHVGAEKEVLEVSSAIAGTMFGIGDGAIEMEFGVGDADSRGAHILEGIKAVASNSHTNTVGFSFPWAHGANKVGVSDLAPRGDLTRLNEVNGVIAKNTSGGRASFGNPLCTATPFVGEGGGADGGVGSREEGIKSFSPASGGMERFARNGGIILKGLGKM